MSNILRGLLIRTPWIDKIFSGSKTWEIRGSSTNIRGRIALIRSGSGLVIGTCELVDVMGPLDLSQMKASVDKHQIPASALEQRLPYKKTFAWTLKNPVLFSKPIPYQHPAGAIIWVKLENLNL